MVRVDLRYVKKQDRSRRRSDGTVWRVVYYYYRRPGAPDDGARLPGQPSDPAFHEKLREFNARATHVPPEKIQGTFAHLVADYVASTDFTDLRDKTKRDYGAMLRRLTAVFGPFPAQDIDREHVLALRDQLRDKPHTANYLIRVLRLVMEWALDRKRIPENPAKKPKMLKVKQRRTLWSLEDEDAFLAKADAPMRLAYLLHAYTAQRQGDILAMTWAQFNGDTIRLRQAKTDELIEVLAHRTLRAALTATPRVSTHILTDARGRPWLEDNFRHHWRRVTLAAGLDGLQNRDLRRTAMVRMAEAGATDIQIAAVSGHDIETTRRILETYIPRNSRMAAEAVKMLEAAGPRPKQTHQT